MRRAGEDPGGRAFEPGQRDAAAHVRRDCVACGSALVQGGGESGEFGSFVGDDSGCQWRSGSRGLPNGGGIVCPCLGTAAPAEGVRELGEIGHPDGGQEERHEWVVAPAIVRLAEHSPDGIAHEDRCGSFVAEHPAPTAGGHELAGLGMPPTTLDPVPAIIPCRRRHRPLVPAVRRRSR